MKKAAVLPQSPKDIAHLLDEISVLMELKGENPFKVRAYQNAARTLEGSTEDLAALDRAGKLQTLSGIGKGISGNLHELLTTGQIAYYEELRKSFPSGLLELLEIPGLGPKRVKVLYDELDLKSVGELEYACKENRLLALDGFGEKLQEKILEGVRYLRKVGDQHLVDFARHEAARVRASLEKVSSVTALSEAGSLRRSKETIRDLDFVAAARKPEPMMKAFCAMLGVAKVLMQGVTKSSILLDSGIQVDLRVVEPDQYPYALLYLTGSKEHNVALRARAQRQGYKLNEYGLFKGNRLVRCRSEEEIYEALGLAYIPPELREDQGELAAAEKGKLPVLIEERDVRGVFHCHSTWSDGTASIEEMARQAKRLGLEYFGLSDHSQSARYAGGLTQERVLDQHKEVDKVNASLKGLRVLKGSEVDILKDGGLDYPDAFLARFDFVIASIHSSFTLPEAEMTRRIVRAIHNPHVTLLGHPTGRLLLARQGYAVRVEEVIREAAKVGTGIEINANPHRLDLDWRVIRTAREAGVPLFINPDAHAPEGVADYRYGVGIARKGWLTAKDVVNTKGLADMLKYLEARKKKRAA